MGYSKTLELGDSFAFGGTITPAIPVSAIATTYFVSTITIDPTYVSRLKKVYVDVSFRALKNFGLGANDLDNSFWIDVNDGHGTSAHANQMTTGMFYQEIGAGQTAGCTLYGDRDCVAAFRHDGTASVYFTDWSCSELMKFYDLQAIARVILG